MLQKLENEEVIYTADGDPNDPTYAFLGAWKIVFVRERIKLCELYTYLVMSSSHISELFCDNQIYSENRQIK